MKHLEKFAGNRRVDTLDTTLLTRFRNQRKIKASTMRKETENLKSFFIFCVGQGWIAANPARGLKCPEDKSPGALPFDRAETKVILAAVDKISNRNPIAAQRARVRARALILAVNDAVGLRGPPA
jgi:site-specific recombinase XerD